MKSKKPLGFLLSLFLVAVVSVSAIYADAPFSKKEIAAGFDKIQANLEHAKNLKTNVVAEGNGVQISMEDFIFYKGSLELSNSLQTDKSAAAATKLSDQQIVENLISTALTAKRATELGLTVSDEEIDMVIAKEREALQMKNDPDNDMVRELMTNRIRITGLTEDEFYSSDYVRNKYAESILIGKLYDKLHDEKTINDMQDFLQYKQNLFKAGKTSVSINNQELGD
ncbi:SurA N-terminal domain-containing protein [Paenibacillus sp. GCM10027626]|uniref:SurA N-terminal domain-containing protein n=1 Tax=Paenibacillus sp. GCM10027626 TaxID=3273411 RepID=UPI003642BF19